MITSFNNGPFTVTRRAAPTTDASGNVVPGSTSSISVDGSIQQLNARERLLLPEGQRSKEMFKLYTATALLVADEATGVPGDLLTFDGRQYEVVGIENWNLTDIAHYKVILQKLDGQVGTRS